MTNIRKSPAVPDECEQEQRREAAQSRLEELKAQQELGRYIVGMVIEDSEEQGKIRVKMLALPGYCGPEMNMDRSLAESLHKSLGEYLRTGQRQER